MKTITLCGSITAYRQLVRVKHELEELGWQVLVPELANRMEKTGHYDLTNETFEEKVEATKLHFEKISRSGAILVVNEPKNGFEGYIGPAVLMEMAIAFYLKKPIYLINTPDAKLANLNEINVLSPIVIGKEYQKI